MLVKFNYIWLHGCTCEWKLRTKNVRKLLIIIVKAVIKWLVRLMQRTISLPLLGKMALGIFLAWNCEKKRSGGMIKRCQCEPVIVQRNLWFLPSVFGYLKKNSSNANKSCPNKDWEGTNYACYIDHGCTYLPRCSSISVIEWILRHWHESSLKNHLCYYYCSRSYLRDL